MENIPAEPLPALDAALDALNNQAMLPGEDGQPVAVPPMAPIAGIQYDHPKDPYSRIYIPRPMHPLLMNSQQRKRHELSVLEVERYRELSLAGRSPVGRDAPSRRGEPSLIYYNPPRLLEGNLLDGESVPEASSVAVAQPPGGLNFGDYDDSDDETYDEAIEGRDTTDESENGSEFAMSVRDCLPEGGRRLRTRGNNENSEELVCDCGYFSLILSKT